MKKTEGVLPIMFIFGVCRIAFCLALGIVFSGDVTAQSAAPPVASSAGGKTAVVYFQDAIVNSNEGKKEFDALQQRFSPRNNALKAQNDEVEKLKAQLQTQGDKLSEAERGRRMKELTEKQKALQRSYEDFQAEIQQSEQEIVGRLGQKMMVVLEKYAGSNGYGVVLDASNPQTSPVLWASAGNNITKELVDAYNAENPVSGVPAASAPKPAAPATKPAAPTPKKP
jgi:outer membrane protein